MSETVAASSARGGSAGAPGSRRWWVLAALLLAQLTLVLDSTVMNVALPSTQADLGFTDADRQWVITAYALAFGGLLLVGGRLSDTLGRKRMLLIAMSGFVGASVLGGFASGFVMLVVARPSGGVRRIAGAGHVVAAGHDVHRVIGPGKGLRRIRRGLQQRQRGRPAARRFADRISGLALVPAGERRDRHRHHRRRHSAVATDERAEARTHPIRLVCSPPCSVCSPPCSVFSPWCTGSPRPSTARGPAR